MKEEWVWGGESVERVSGSLEDEAMSFGGSSWSRSHIVTILHN